MPSSTPFGSVQCFYRQEPWSLICAYHWICLTSVGNPKHIMAYEALPIFTESCLKLCSQCRQFNQNLINNCDLTYNCYAFKY